MTRSRDLADFAKYQDSGIDQDLVPDEDGTRLLGSEEKRYIGIHSDKINGGALSGFRNRFINPDHSVDIEGNAAGVTAISPHVVEGWPLYHNNDVTTQTLSRTTGRVAGTYALRYTVTTGSDASLAAGQFGYFLTAIEGYDVADFAWGTSDAKAAYLSFWVRSNTTGTFAVSIRNSASNRSYVEDVTINAANTWERKEITIPGDTTGTWEKTTSVGWKVGFCLGTGSTYQGTSGAWAASGSLGTPTQDNFLDTNGNWLEITEPQIERGGFSPFEWRPYAQNLAHCQRYYCETQAQIRTYATNPSALYESPIYWPQTMRAAPTASIVATGLSLNLASGSPTLQGTTTTTARWFIQSAAAGDVYALNYTIGAAARLI